MTDKPRDMSTDAAWEEWGRSEPYFGVITDPRFRRTILNEQTKQEFFESGATHIQNVLATIRRHIDPAFSPRSVLDFGCGVGRLLVAFAAVADDVVGLDVSPSMLDEAQRNLDERHLRNVRLLLSDDQLSRLTGSFDLIHSYIVFQHIPVLRGQVIFSNLLRHLRPGGAAVVHFTYAKISAPVTIATSPSPPPPRRTSTANETHLTTMRNVPDPDMQMNPYNVNEILFEIQRHGVEQMHVEFSDHGGEMGLFLFFAAPGQMKPT